MNVLSTLDAIEDAINRDEKGDALAILQNARDILTEDAAEPVTPAKENLRTELDNVVSALDEIDSFIHVCLLAHRQQNCDADGSVAVVLDTTWGRVSDARAAIETAIDLLTEVAP